MESKRRGRNKFALPAVSLLLLFGAWIVLGGIMYVEVGEDYPGIWEKLLGWSFLSLLGPAVVGGILPGAMGRQKGREKEGAARMWGSEREARETDPLSILRVAGQCLLGGFLYAVLWTVAIRWGDAIIVMSVAQKMPGRLLLVGAVGLMLAGVLSGFLGAVWRRG